MPPVPTQPSATALSRRTASVGLLAAVVSAVGSRPARAAAAAPAPAAAPASTRQAAHPEIEIASPAVLQSLAARDAAATFKCKGGMFDCDGDRRDFAKKQYKNFLEKRAAVEGGK